MAIQLNHLMAKDVGYLNITVHRDVTLKFYTSCYRTMCLAVKNKQKENKEQPSNSKINIYNNCPSVRFKLIHQLNGWFLLVSFCKCGKYNYISVWLKHFVLIIYPNEFYFGWRLLAVMFLELPLSHVCFFSSRICVQMISTQSAAHKAQL